MTVTSDPPTGVANIELRQGQTFSQQILIVDSALVALNFASGYTADMQVRTTAASSAIVVELSSANGKITLQAGTNDEVNVNNIVPNIILSLADEETAALTPGNYVYDLFVEATGTDTNVPWLAGRFRVVQAVTHA